MDQLEPCMLNRNEVLLLIFIYEAREKTDYNLDRLHDLNSMLKMFD